MNSKETFEKIMNRSKHVMACGNECKITYSKYLQESLLYDNLKKGFYIAAELARLDGNITEEELQRYEHLVKHFDQQLLSQLKERNYLIQKIQIEDEVSSDTFQNRVSKIEAQGLLRNRMFFEFVDYKKEFDEAKTKFYTENSLALRDGLITDIDQKIHTSCMKEFEKHLEEEMKNIRTNFKQQREHSHFESNSGFNPSARNTRGSNGRGRGGNRRGRGGNRRGRGGNRRGRGGNRRGRGGNRRGREFNDRGRRRNGHNENSRSRSRRSYMPW